MAESVVTAYYLHNFVFINPTVKRGFQVTLCIIVKTRLEQSMVPVKMNHVYVRGRTPPSPRVCGGRGAMTQSMPPPHRVSILPLPESQPGRPYIGLCWHRTEPSSAEPGLPLEGRPAFHWGHWPGHRHCRPGWLLCNGTSTCTRDFTVMWRRTISAIARSRHLQYKSDN